MEDDYVRLTHLGCSEFKAAEGSISKQQQNKQSKPPHETQTPQNNHTLKTKPNQTKQAEGGQFPYTWKTFLWAPGMRR